MILHPKLKTKKERFFCNKIFHRTFWPCCLSNFCLMFSSIIDAVAVGSKMGAAGLAAIGIVSPVYIFYNILGYGFSVGGSVAVARMVGTGEEKQANEHFNGLCAFAVLCSAVIGVLGYAFITPVLRLLGGAAAGSEVMALSRDYASVLFLAFPMFMANFLLYDFVRADDDSFFSTLSYVVGCCLDVGLNCLLVIVLDYGVKGAAWSTVIAQTVSVLIGLMHFFRKKGVLRIRFSGFDIKRTLKSFSVGFATSVSHLWQFIVLILSNNLLARFSAEPALYVAVFDVVQNVSYIGAFISTAATETVAPLASTFCAEQSRDNLQGLLRLSLIYGCGGSFLLGAVMATLASPLAAFFGLTEAMAADAVRLYCAGIGFAAFVVIAASFLQATGRDKLAGVVTTLRTAAVLLPLTAIFGVFFTARFWQLLPLAEIISAGIVLIFFRRRLQPEVRAVFSCTLSGDSRDMGLLLAEVEQYLDSCGAAMRQSLVVNLVLEELCTTIIGSAFTGSEDEYIQITVSPRENGDFVLHVRDSAVSFNPFEAEGRKITADAGEEAIAAVSVMMIKAKTKEFYYRRYHNFNVLTVVV